jgi:hypothetical protein
MCQCAAGSVEGSVVVKAIKNQLSCCRQYDMLRGINVLYIAPQVVEGYEVVKAIGH